MKLLILLTAFSVLFLTACDSNDTVSTTLESQSTSTQPSGSSENSNTSCTGTTADGQSDVADNPSTLNPSELFHYEVNLAGTQGWMIGNSLDSNTTDLEQAFQSLNNDGAYYIRFKVNPSVRPPDNEVYCPGRVNQGWMFHYSKLQFSIYRHAYYVKFDGNYQVVDYKKAAPGVFLTTTPLITENKCSDVIKVSPLTIGTPPLGYQPITVFEIKTARSDAQCRYCKDRGNCIQSQVDGFYCPSFDMRKGDCWAITVQVATNRTKFFKGHKRN